MATHSSFITKVITAGSFVVAAALIAPASLGFHGFSTNAFAEDDGSHEGGTSGHKGTKGGSDKGKGTDSGHGSKKDTVSKGQGGPDASSDGKGPKAGSGGTGGTKPVWASEGIPVGDYGRLNVARAPQNTRDQALAEALKTITDWTLYTGTLEAAELAIYNSNNPATPIVRVDSPTQSLALYQAVLRDGSIPAIGGGSTFVQAAIFLASAADKSKVLDPNAVTAMNTILGVKSPGTGTEAENDLALYIAAEKIRLAIQTAHDE
ncbi:MAG: hypothetical protein WC680_03930 [Sulfuricurvum sp.]|jgi:hypothetical protein